MVREKDSPIGLLAEGLDSRVGVCLQSTGSIYIDLKLILQERYRQDKRREETVKLKLIVQVTILIVLLAGVSQAATTMTVLGHNPFHNPPLKSVEDLRAVMAEAKVEVEEGLKIAGYPELYQPLMEQFPQAEIRTVEYQKGEAFQWMLYKRKGKGKVKVMKDMTWGGDKPITGYEFYIDSDGVRYTFAVPLVCANLALKNTAFAPAMKKVEPAPVEVAPTPVGEVKPAVAEEISPLGFVADIGYLHQMDPANYVFARVGFDFMVNEKFSVLAMLGAAPNVHGSDGQSAVLVDFIGEYSWSRMFVGLGLGAWITSGDDDLDAEDTDLDIIANIGYRVCGEPGTLNTSLFLEARSGIDELDDFTEYGRFGIGMRVRF